VGRVSGDDRFATAGALAPGVDGDTLWVATGFDFADALTAGATGAGPVLLVAGDSAPPATLDAAAALEGIERVRTVGGPGAVAEEAVQAVADAAGVADVARLAGSQRFETAAQVSADAHPNGASVAYVATGLAFADALTASAAAADADAPVLLAAGDTLPQATADELDRLDPDEIVVVGGEAAVGPGVEAELGEHADEVTRVAGGDRFATAAAVSQHRGINPAEAFMATGQNFPDVLAAAPAAISGEAALLLSSHELLPETTREEMTRVGLQEATIVGGESAVSASVADEIHALLRNGE
jgi:putative cell wall-binding protein